MQANIAKYVVIRKGRAYGLCPSCTGNLQGLGLVGRQEPIRLSEPTGTTTAEGMVCQIVAFSVEALTEEERLRIG